MQFQRRMSRGLQALVSYNFARSSDLGSSEISGATAPIVPLLARLETDLLGPTPLEPPPAPDPARRVHGCLSGAYVRRLGGSLRLQTLALLIAVAAPYFLGANWVYQTVTFDEATWMVAFCRFMCLVRERRPSYWIDLDLSLGIGLEAKYTIAGLAAAIGLAVLLTPTLRSDLRTRHPWIAAGMRCSSGPRALRGRLRRASLRLST